ncbi:ribosome maturation factor RimM [Lottiidibacillus patelloidae]|uniref:Ribosome maturation factor RimM n=1 Tax=Lottiidibacillus patelloidae TaxID=2670334 RepID=A0A263BXX4_9BACI|nr:ribosome maturation factor RimM [Lottiidibacillus patelloidae]OZM58579.1 ribosome maturation factor RimM [Lottiidibacillus patelloidae]
MSKWFNVGKIVNTQGIKGEVRVIASTDFPEERFAKGNVLYIDHAELQEKLEVKVATHRKHKNFDLISFVGYSSINDVERFKGGILQVNEDQLIDLSEHENEFYYHEIIGCLVKTVDGEQLGEVKEILSPGANDVWVVKRKGKNDLLLPYIEDVVKEINIEEKEIIVELLEGLE